MRLFQNDNNIMNQLFDELVAGGAIVEPSVFTSAYSQLPKNKFNSLYLYWLVYQDKHSEAYSHIVEHDIELSAYPLSVVLSAIKGAGSVNHADAEQLATATTFLSQLNLEHTVSDKKRQFAPKQFVAFDERVPNGLLVWTVFIKYLEVATINGLWTMGNTLSSVQIDLYDNASQYLQ